MIFALRALASVPGTGTDPSDGSAASGSGSATTSPAQLAWQGVIYLPENIVSSSTGTDGVTTSTARTTLTFNAQAKTADGKSVSDNPYTVKLIEGGKQNNEDAAATDIERAHFYDLCLKATKLNKTEITVSVSKWDVEKLIYDLHGPYTLHVDKTGIDVKSGEKTAIWYAADAEIETSTCTFKVGEKEYKVFDITNDNDSIYVGIHPELPSTYFEDVRKRTDNYFEVKSGSLVKKISVNIKELTYFLERDPGSISLDVRELKTLGYSGSFPINISTNLSSFEVELVKYNSDNSDWKEAFKNDAIKLCYNNQKIPFNNNGKATFTSGTGGQIVDGKMTIRLEYQGLNSGYSIWKDKTRTLQLKINYTLNGEAKDKSVYVDILPPYDEYVIHLLAPGWTDPHIYVYQCLEFPEWFTGTANGVSLASKPIGYCDDKDSPEYMAALEYSFTGKIAFKGWDDPVNAKSLETYNSGNWYYGKNHKGFFIFDGSYKKKDGVCEWNPAVSLSDKRFYKEMDLCSDQRNNGCASCGKTTRQSGDWPNGYNTLWPGVRMKTETTTDVYGRQWYEFRLSGLATPGKALIMFSDGHTYEDCKQNHGLRRYPADSEVGIPLFDYPSKEGWFDLTGDAAFTSSLPAPTKNTVYVVINATDWNKENIHAYCYGDNDAQNAAWPGVKMTSIGGNVFKITTDKVYKNITFNDGSKQFPATGTNISYEDGKLYQVN